MEQIPEHISIIFILTTLLTVYLFYKASHHSKTAIIVILFWLILQTVLGLTGFYSITDTIPPRIIFLGLPPLVIIISLFITKKGKTFLEGLDLKLLTILHVVRIPVELVLYALFVVKAIPELMTFEGRNFDILAGLSAPLIYYYGFVKKLLSYKMILIWNFICLGLLLNIVINAVLSVPSPIQQFAFDQPNVAVLCFPYNGLPSCIVPLVLLAHLVAIRQLIKHE
jgi:hypothetical protein